jgi:hypothetical protein
MPHTWIVWDMHKELHSHITIQEIGVVRYPIAIENYHISILGLRKHFLYVCCLGNYMPLSVANLENFSQKNNTLRDIVFKKKYNNMIYFQEKVHLFSKMPR